MDNQLKHRLIGAVVILALVVIFVPMLFSKHAREKISTIAAIPAAPQKPEIVQQMQANGNQPIPGTTTTTQPTASAPTTANQTTATTPSMSVTAATDNNAPASTASATTATAQTTADNQNSNSVGQIQVEEVPPLNNAEVDNLLHQTQQAANEPVNSPDQTAQTSETAPTNVASSDENSPEPVDSVSAAAPEIQLAQEAKKAPSPDVLSAAHASIVEKMTKSHIRTNTASSSNAVITKKHKKELAKAASQKNAWIVQLGSFNDRTNAMHLIEKLRSKGFTAFGYPKKHGQVVATQVFIGPVIQLDKAKVLQEKVQTAMHMKGIIMKFDATKLQ